jgi:nucleoid DNA-binding protein
VKKMVAKKAKVVKKSVAAKPVAKKEVAAKVAPVKKPTRDNTPAKAAFTKSQIVAELSRTTLLSKKQISEVVEELTHLISRHLRKNAIGSFNLPGLFKIVNVHKPAVKARKGISPFTKEEVMFKAKPARTVVKVRALKGLKDMV